MLTLKAPSYPIKIYNNFNYWVKITDIFFIYIIITTSWVVVLS